MNKPLFRYYIKMVWVLSFAIMLTAVSSRTLVAEQRHHDAHVHGIAHLNAAMEETTLHLEFTSPAANIVGFEHAPQTQEQKDAVRKALEKLEDGSKLFIPSPEAQCRLSKSSVKTDIENDIDHDEDADHETEHEHEKDAHHGKGEDKDHKHDEEGEDEHVRHSEFEAEYRLVCQHPEKLSKVEVMLIQNFPGIEHIAVQLLTGTKQTAQELTHKKSFLKF